MARKVHLGVEFNGSPIYHITHLAINQPINGHHTFELRCSIREQENSLMDAAEAYIGKEIKIEIAPGISVDNTKNYFQGIITNIRLSKHQGAFDEIVYEGFSPTIKMDDGPHAQSFLDKKLKAIVSDVVGKYSLDTTVDPTFSTKIPYFVQYNESSFQYINRLANLYGEWFYYDGTKLYFGKPHQQEANLELVFGRDLSSFDFGLNLSPSKFKLLGYDYLGHKYPESPSASSNVGGLDDYGKTLARSSDEVFSNEPTYVYNHEISSKADLDAFSLNRKAASSGNYVIFNGSSDNHRITLGSIIKVKGKFGDAQGQIMPIEYGSFRIIHITQSIDGTGNYQNHFKAVPASLEKPPVIHKMPIVFCEMQPAEILDNHDPEKLGRVKVQFWWQKATGDETPWIRVAASGAGSGHGAFFVPEKGDQVFVAFEHNNPNRPYVLGSLYHGKSKPEGVADPNNNKKVIKTKSGNQIYLSDEGGSEEIKIENGSNVIVLSLAGSGKISITTAGDMELKAKNIVVTAEANFKLNADNIEMEAKTDLKEKAGGNINIDASSSLDLKAGGTAKMSGQDTEMKANNTATVNGSAEAVLAGAMAKVNGQGIVEVVGTMIKLN